jgi:hypothetical protein
LLGWAWAIAGLIAGALIGSLFVKTVQLPIPNFLDNIPWVIVIALLGSVIGQIIGASSVSLVFSAERATEILGPGDILGGAALIFIGSALPVLAFYVYFSYWFITSIGPQYGLASTAFLLGLAAKLVFTFVIKPLWQLLKDLVLRIIRKWAETGQ